MLRLDWLWRLFRARSLARVRGPTRVSLKGTISAPNLVTSPMSGRREALIHYSFFLRPPLQDEALWTSRYALPEALVATGLLVEPPLLVEAPSGIVEVPATGLRVFCAGAFSGGAVVEEPLPPLLSHVEAQVGRHRGGELYYRELWLSVGERVRLVGTVVRADARGAAYRAAGTAPFRVDANLEPPLLVAEE